MLGTEHRLTTTHHHQTNATERVNCTLKTAVRAFVGDKHTSWEKYIPQICFALRIAPHESTGLSASMMLYGRELDTPLDLIPPPSWEGVDETETSYPDELRASLQDAHEDALTVLSESHKRRKRYYDLKHRPVSYKVGDLVRVKSHPKSDASSNFAAKLAPLYTGPYRVSRKMSDLNYCLTKVDTGEKAGVFYVANLKLSTPGPQLCLINTQSKRETTACPLIFWTQTLLTVRLSTQTLLLFLTTSQPKLTLFLFDYVEPVPFSLTKTFKAMLTLL